MAVVCTSSYLSPLGPVTLACDDQAVIGLWFDGQRYFGSTLPPDAQRQEHPLLDQAKKWLDIYFSGHDPRFLPPIRYGSTPFRKAVCDVMLTIPYGGTMTYGQIAAALGRQRMSARAVGLAVGRNPISLLIPCHRVVGADGSLTGYSGGLSRKAALLELERSGLSGTP